MGQDKIIVQIMIIETKTVIIIKEEILGTTDIIKIEIIMVLEIITKIVVIIIIKMVVIITKVETLEIIKEEMALTEMEIETKITKVDLTKTDIITKIEMALEIMMDIQNVLLMKKV